MLCPRHADHTSRTHRAAGQPALPRHDELRPADDRGRLASRSWTARSSSASTSSTPPTSTAGRRARASTEQIVGRWFAQGGGRREKVVLATKVYGAMGDWPNDGAPLGAAHPPRLRGRPAAPADRPHRPLPDAPRRPRRAVGRDLAGDGDARRAGQGHLRRLVELRRLAHRAGATRRAKRAALPRPRVASRASTTCVDRTVELEVLPACQALRPRRHPVEPARGRHARRRARSKAERGPPRDGARAAERSRSTAPQLEACEKLCAELGEEPARRRARLAAAQPAVTAPIIGPRTLEQLDGVAAGARDHARRRDAEEARRDLPRPGRPRARGLRLVAVAVLLLRSLAPPPSLRVGSLHSPPGSRPRPAAGGRAAPLVRYSPIAFSTSRFGRRPSNSK